MASIYIQYYIFITTIFLFHTSLLISSSPQNIETFYNPPPPPSLPPLPPPPPPDLPVSPSTSFEPSPSPSSPPPGPKKAILKAVVATFAASAAVSGLLFFLFRRCVAAKKKKAQVSGLSQHKRFASMKRSDFARYDGAMKGLIVDENGLDIFYWRKLRGQPEATKSNSAKKSGSSHKVVDSDGSRRSRSEKAENGTRTPSSREYKELVREEKPEEMSIPEVALLRGNSTSSTDDFYENRPGTRPARWPQEPPQPPPAPHRELLQPPRPLLQAQERTAAALTIQSQPNEISHPRPPSPPARPSPPQLLSQEPLKPPPVPPPMPSVSSLAVQSQSAKVSPPKPPPLPPAAMTPPVMTNRKAPPPPPPPRPPPKEGGSETLPKPPPMPLRPKPVRKEGKIAEESSSFGERGSAGDGDDGQVKMKPLHWEKVNISGTHSMVWDKIDGGSFRVDDDLMEALFGSVATNRRSTQEKNTQPSKPDTAKSNSSSKIFILDTRKSQNIAIVLRSLGASRREILDSLHDGHGLPAETLERLNRIAPTKEEQSQIIRFDGEPSRLADAESFLYQILKEYPSAFTCFNAMLFKLNYDSEITQLRESMSVLELGCRELRNKGVFVKLLEAILKAGNRMNAGTARGNAHAFNLNSLRKLSDVKSIDGKTTLLHFVVEEVVRGEGKRCVLNRSRQMGRSNSRITEAGQTPNNAEGNNSMSREEREKEYMLLGLPVVGCLSVEFLNVKKAAGIDYTSFSSSAASLSARLAEIQRTVLTGAKARTGYQREMQEFLEEAEQQLESVRKEQAAVMALVKKTTEYYHAGEVREGGAMNPLQIFVIVTDFLAMVDKVCVEIARNLQKKKRIVSAGATPTASTESSAAASRPAAKFPNLPAHFMSEKSGSSASDDSDTEL